MKKIITSVILAGLSTGFALAETPMKPTGDGPQTRVTQQGAPTSPRNMGKIVPLTKPMATGTGTSSPMMRAGENGATLPKEYVAKRQALEKDFETKLKALRQDFETKLKALNTEYKVTIKDLPMMSGMEGGMMASGTNPGRPAMMPPMPAGSTTDMMASGTPPMMPGMPAPRPQETEGKAPQGKPGIIKFLQSLLPFKQALAQEGN